MLGLEGWREGGALFRNIYFYQKSSLLWIFFVSHIY